MTLLSIVHAFTLAEPQAPTGSKEGNAAVTDFVDNLHKCSQCEEAEAELLCIDCTKEFCSGCFKVLHKSSKKKGHKTQAIEGAAGAAESSGAEMCFQVNTRKNVYACMRACMVHTCARTILCQLFRSFL
jgi:hypothetical protein